MAKFDIFVGREEELKIIDTWVQRRGTIHLIAVQGGGGVGKTWLLKEIQRRYGDQDEFVVVYWDYAENPATGLSQVAALYRDLGIQQAHFLSELALLQQNAYDWSPAKYKEKKRRLFQTSIKELSPLLRGRRLIYLADTMELMTTTEDSIDQYFSQFPNALFIGVGRDILQEHLPRFRQTYHPDDVTYLQLHNFDRVESETFFARMDKEGFIAPEIRTMLHFLTDGRPVLLSLSVEWMARHVPLPMMTEYALADLRKLPDEELAELRQTFEFELVDRVRQLKNPLDRAILYMAHIHRRNNAEILAALLDISPPEAKRLVRDLAALSFVRYNPSTGSCLLHDEMKNLVNKHAWPYVDPTRAVRRRLTRKVIARYYEPRITALMQEIQTEITPASDTLPRVEISEAEWLLWQLEAECLHYHLLLSEEEGLAYFEERFADAQRKNHLMRIQFLISEMDIADQTEVRNRVELRRAELLRRRGELEQAREICERALREEDSSLDNRISAYVTLGWVAAASNLDEARGHFQRALDLAQNQGDAKLMGVFHNNLGMMYRLSNQLEPAVAHYQEAIKYGRQAENVPLVASATNNLAYIYRLWGDLPQADAMCRVALVQRKKLGLERDLGYSYVTKAEIDRDRGDLESAERYTKLALRIFDRLSESRGRILAYQSMANIMRHLGHYDEAKSYLEQGIDLAQQMNNYPLLASLYDVYGRTERDSAVHTLELRRGEMTPEQVERLFSPARDYLERSQTLARQYGGDPWLQTRGEWELALTYFLSGTRPIAEIRTMLDEVWEEAIRLDYAILQGYIQEVRGEIALRRRDYEAAAEHFAAAAKTIAAFSGREPARFFDRLSEYLLDVGLPAEAGVALAQGISDEIGELPPGEFLQSLAALCKQILMLQAT